uniref:hypothetical protein n=1 Tax=Streptomyces sp. S1 TaxID=718288 RepID=UPI003D75313D
VDPVYGGNLNAYEYSHADPLNRFDLDGKKSWWKKQWNRFTKTRVGNWAYRNRNKIARYAGLVALGVCVVASAGANAVLLSTSSPSASATRWAT